MSKFIRFAMKNAGVIFLSMLLIIGGGIYSRASMKMEEMPNIDIPYLSVVVVYPGATPEQSLEDVGKPMEQALSNLKGIKNIYMSAANDYVAATLEFELGKPVDEAERDINSALATVKLPDSAQKPRVSAQGPNAMPIYSFGVTADADQATIQQYVNDKIKPALVAVAGIAKIDVQGTSEKNLYIKVDPEKLSKENLTLDNVKQTLLANNVGVPAGQLTLDGKDLNVEVRKKINSVDDAKKIDLVVVKQDMSSLTDAFKSVGDGFGQVGSSMGKIGQGVGNLTKGQLLLQAQIQLVQGISGLTTQLATEQASLSALNEQLQMAKSNPQKAAAIQGQIAQLNQAIPKQTAQLNQLKQQLAGLQAQVQASGSDTVNVLQSLGGQSAPTTKSDASVTPELNVRTIKLGDIADISYASGKDSMITRLNGKSAVVTDITAEPGTNVVDVVKQINEKLDGLKLPAGYKLTKLRDSSVQVQKSVNTMQREAILGALFAMLITFIFLRNLRSTIVAILAIPLSIFASLIVLYLLDYSLNIMTLAGIAVAVGRVVDDSIVVLENIYRRVRSSESRDRELIVYAAKEVGQAVTSSTITTVAVFTPLMFVPGMVGRFFKPFGITVIVSLIFSLLVAITVVPLLSRLFLLNIKHREPRENALQKGYRSLLNWSLNHKLVIVVLAAALIGGSLTLVTKVPQNFLPSEKTASYALTVTMPVGTATTKTDGIANRLED
ncbi:MAG TPA: efflux RND transporter permease subunit, partial [Desulfobacteria bacterium]|nr:efflux RND transporter permease subunit [Desulfobacteria bacterium]